MPSHVVLFLAAALFSQNSFGSDRIGALEDCHLSRGGILLFRKPSKTRGKQPVFEQNDD